MLSRIGSSKKLTTVIEDMGPASQGMWSNKDTLLVRAPAAEFDRLAPLFSIIQGSIQLNPVWAAGEMRGQRQRAAAARETQLYLQEVGRQIVENRRQTNAEIAYGMYLFMNDQREYVNLHTHQREVGSNQWKHRWQSASGEIVYTDDPSYDPNRDPNMERSDFKRSQTR